MPKIFALVPAAGQGTRIGDAVPKQYLPLAGKPMMFHCVETLASVPRIESVLVILSPLDRHWSEHDWSAFPEKIEATFTGGPNRGASVRNTLRHLEGRVAKDDWILVHDAARPCIPRSLVEQFLDEVGDDPIGGLLAMPLADTLKRAEDTMRVEETIPRARLWRAQTPQMFRFDALARGLDRRPDATDEAQAVESLGHAPRLVQGANQNIKVTFAEDVALAEMILERRRAVEAARME
ncbi:2-C-methyl-D-erythritol 4-phosphate cytidylyltransferase [Usitatibacter palustris]|uniref:2-C-methyl-D-erythritol 4-phosphate cytidylyltransferase n=1 Tax=Usitatibacter palustris TaxID=2732487 RepID=A0A6M4H805_9PROT|nr:2-C-methyl-D-erythritol 4-phosphate cytidylyltransferase [Usitatibacter palustris]QJR15502.1 2-C-methyl-D-erythritol 4-phosphate cytidylyltransferase [Usitatibacter palustris]